MKHRYPVQLLVALFVPASFGQTPFERADQRTFQVYYGPCAALGSGWAVAGSFSEDDGSPGYGLLRAFDAAGTPTWEVIQEDGFNQVYTNALSTLQNGDLISSSNLIECDVLVPYFLAERRDTTGTLIWSKTYPFPYVGDVAVGPGDSLAFSTDMGVLITDAQGDSLTSFEANGSSGASLVWDGANSLLLSGWSGALSRWSLSGTLLASAELEPNIVDVRWWQGHRLVLTNDGWLRTFDEDLNALDSVAVGPPSYYRQLLPLDVQLVVADNTISVVLNTALSIVGSIGMDPAAEFPDELFHTFAANDHAILQVAPAPTAQRSAGLVRTVSLNGDFAPHPENVSIEVLGFDSVYYQLQNGIIFPSADVTVRVTNLAPSVLNDVMVCHFLAFGPICGSAGTSVAVQNAGSAFGESIDVTLTGLYLNYGPWGQVNTDQVVCIGALSPNNLYDRDQSDNYACDTVHIVLGIQDPIADRHGLIVTNPFADAIDMAFTAPSPEPLRATLFDATGRQVAATRITAGSSRFHWDLPGLSNGVHLLRLEDHSTTTTRTLIHQQP